MTRDYCQGSGKPAKPDVRSFGVTGVCPECDMRLAIQPDGRMRQHKLPSARQLERRREYLTHVGRSQESRV
jgi:hypothetical protein